MNSKELQKKIKRVEMLKEEIDVWISERREQIPQLKAVRFMVDYNIKLFKGIYKLYFTLERREKLDNEMTEDINSMEENLNSILEYYRKQFKGKPFKIH